MLSVLFILYWESGFARSPYFALFTFGYFNSLARLDQYIECEFNGIYQNCMKIFGLTCILVFISIPDVPFLTPYTRILLRYSTMQNIIRTSITFTYCNSRVI